MSKIRRCLLIIVTISTIIFVIGCDISKDKTTSSTEEIDSSHEDMEVIDSLAKEGWKNYLQEAKYDRNLLDIGTPNEYKIDIEFNPVQNKYIGKQLVRYVNNEEVSL